MSVTNSSKMVMIFALLIVIVSVSIFGILYSINYFEVEKNYNKIVRESYDTQKSLDEYIPMRLCEIADAISSMKSNRSLSKAIMYYRKALNVNSIYINAYLGLSSAYLRKNKFSKAKTCLNRAYELDNTNPKVNSELGFYFYMKRDFAEAEKYLKKSLSLKITAQAYFYLGLVYSETNRYEEAKGAWAKAGNLDNKYLNPNNYFSFGAMKTILSEKYKDIKKAETKKNDNK